MLILAYALHPPSVLPLAPLLFSRDLVRAMRYRALLVAGLLLAIALLGRHTGLFRHRSSRPGDDRGESAVFLMTAIGPFAGLLIVLELFDQWRSR